MRNQKKFGSIDNDQVPELYDPVIENKRLSGRAASLFGGQIDLNKIPTKLLEKTDMLAAQIQRIVKHMNFDCRQQKAERHIYDAYYLRTVRNDIDLYEKKLLKQLWLMENSQLWHSLLFLFALALQMITFFEKPHTKSDQQDAEGLIITELIILLMFLFDFLLTLILLITKPKDGKSIYNFKRMSKLLMFVLCFSDFLIHVSDENLPRFSRLLRPLYMVFYSKDLRRTLKGIVKASRDLLLLFLLYLIVISIFSFIGINLIGSIENVDIKTQDYGDFLKLFSMLYMVSTLDFYPDVLIPPMLDGTYYIIFFVIYLLLFVFLFYPIPLAVVYEGFRSHRMQIAINDIIKQKSAMMASFISLDTLERGYLSEAQFKGFIKNFYRQKLTEAGLEMIYTEIDKDFNDKIQFDEFYQLIVVLQNSKSITLPETQPLWIWEAFRNKMNNLGLKKFTDGSSFGLTMLFVTVVNCVLIIIAFFIEDEEVLNVFNTLDTVFLVFYSLECLLKIIAYGIKNFFDDGWNVFDFSLVILQVMFDYVLFNIVTGNIVQSIKANRILRIAKIQKVFRLFRAFRSVKIISYLLRGFEILNSVKNLLYKILICIPLILRLMLPVQIVFFIYSTMGIYIYGGIPYNEENPYANSSCDLSELQYQWGGCRYADFDSFHGAYLLMLQTFIASEWSSLVFQLTYDTDNMALAMVFVGSFIFLSIFLLALIGGLVWEVFTVVSMSLKEDELKDDPQANYQDEILFSSQGTVQDLKVPSPYGDAAARLKKKTLILNDDNPDTLCIRPRRTKMLSQINKISKKINSEGNEYDKHQIPMEFTNHKVSMKIYNRILYGAGNSKSMIQKKTQPYGDNIEVDISDDCLEIQKLYSEWFIDYNDFLKVKSNLQALNVSAVTQEYIVHLRNEIKKDEIFKQKAINIQNHEQLIQNAVLRDTSEILIKQQEEKYFKNAFGQKFERIKELKFQSKFKIESKILFSLMGILKFPKPNIKYFFQILYLIESYFTYQLLPENSFFKLLYQHGKKWYVITIEENQIVFTKIWQGPWNYSDYLFQDSNFRICENLKFLKEFRTGEFKHLLKDFRKSMGQIAKQYDIDLAQLDARSCCLLYQIKNDKYIAPDSISIQKRSNQNLEDQSPNQIIFNNTNSQQIPLPSQQQTTMNGSDIHKNVSRVIMFILSKINASEPRIVYQNQVMLAQFTQDLAGVINNYASNFFTQLEEIFELKIQHHRTKGPNIDDNLNDQNNLNDIAEGDGDGDGDAIQL